MFFTKKYNYFSRETRRNHPFLSQSPMKGCNCSLKMTSGFICRRLYIALIWIIINMLEISVEVLSNIPNIENEYS